MSTRGSSIHLAGTSEVTVIAKSESSKGPKGYAQKSKRFIEMCQRAKRGDVVSIATPCTLGDSYNEIIESLNRLSDSEVMLLIDPRAARRRVEQEVTAKQDELRRR